MAYNQTGVNVNTLKEMVEVKAKLLDSIDVLLHDSVISREEVACDLLGLVDKLHQLENDMHTQMIAKDYRKLYNLAEEIELEREQKNTSTVQE